MIGALSRLAMFAVGAGIFNTPPTPQQGSFLTQAGTTVGSTDNLGGLTITWPVAFPNGVLTLVVCNGDDSLASMGGATFSVIQPNVSLTQAQVRVRTPAGAAIATTSARCNWIAVGF